MKFSTRFALFCLGVVVPLLFVIASFANFVPKPDWQSGKLYDIVGFLLHPAGSLSIYPFVIYSAVSLAFYLYNEDSYGDAFWVRLGIGSGALVSVWYCIVYSMTIVHVDADDPRTWIVAVMVFGIQCMAAYFVVAVCYLLHRFWTQKNTARRDRWILITLSLTGIYLVCRFLIFGPQSAGRSFLMLPIFPFVVFVALLLCAPGFALFTYSLTSVRIFFSRKSSRQLSLFEAMTITTWIAGFLAACRLSIKMSLSAYSALPTERPSNCYVATAAARGHQRFVGVTHLRSDGMPINDQLCRLKAFELMLMALLPRCHRLVRLAYDRIGPSIVSRLTNKTAADLAFISLKPAEWFASITLWIVLGKETGLIRRLYESDCDAKELK